MSEKENIAGNPNSLVRVKYFRTPHLPWSPGASADDVILDAVEQFVGCEVVVTEKMDGENTTIYSDGLLHARSIDSRDHWTQHPVKGIAGTISHLLPKGWRICGENVFAEHSIAYSELPSYFLLFSVWDENNRCLGWDETVEFANSLGISTVPVLYRGPWDTEKVKACWTGTSKCGGKQEGYVVRRAEGFDFADSSSNIAKFVRKGHVQTDEHWMHGTIKQNKIL